MAALAAKSESGRAAEGLIILVGAFVLSSGALVPDQSGRAFAAEVLAIGLVALLAPLFIQLRSWGAVKGASPAKRYIGLAVNAVAGLPFLVAGALLASGAGAGIHWLAASVIISLATAVWNARVLLVEILR